MKIIPMIILFLTIGISYGQTNDEFMIIGQPNTESCIGVSKPVFIKNLYTAISIKVRYKRIETNGTDLEKETEVLTPNQMIKIGCAVNEGGFERKFEVLSIEKGVSIIDDPSNENQEQILNGTTFSVKLDGSNCPSDIGYIGENDPLGTLLCGKTYTGNFANNKYTFTGHNERTLNTETYTYDNASPNNYKLSIWGVILSFNEENEVYHPTYGLIGTISF